MPTAAINGTELYYLEVGEGPPCLVMHGGLGADHTLYRPFDRLADRVRLVYYDHRGNGRSGRPPLASLTMEQLADDAAGLADHLGADRVLVIGHSFGGFIAQEFALRHPGRLAALVLLDTTPGQLGATESLDDEQGPPPPPEFLEAISSFPETQPEYEALMRKLLRLYVHRADPAALEPLLADAILDRDAAVRGFEFLPYWSSADRLHEIAAPTLVVVGRHDPVTSWPQAYRIGGRVPGAEVVVLEESGHIPWVDEPDRFFEVVADWLGRHSLVRRGHSSIGLDLRGMRN